MDTVSRMPRTGDRLVISILGAFTAVLLLVTRARDLTGDSLAYAQAIKTGERLFHPHHLLFAAVVRAIHRALSWVHDGVDAVFSAQLHNVAWAVVAVVAVYAIVVASGGSRALAAAAGATLLACRGFAAFATQVDAYVPAAGCAALLLWMLLREGPPHAERSRFAATVALLSLLVLYHQSNVLFCIPLMVLVVVSGERARVVFGLRVVALSGLVVLGVYVAVYLFAGENASGAAGFLDYVLRYATGTFSPQWGSAENVGGTGVVALLESQHWNVVADGRTGAARSAFAALLAALIAWHGLRLVRPGRATKVRPYRAALLAWLLAYGAFFLWWLPAEHEFFVITLVPLVLLTVLAVQDVAPVLAGALLVVSLGVLLPWNVAFALWPAHRTRGSAAEVARLYHDAAPECIHLNGRQVVQALRYYHDLEPEECLNVKLYRRRFVQPVAGDVVEPLPAGHCVAVPLFEALPPGEATGRIHDDAVGWFEYYRWLFRMTPAGSRVEAPAVVQRRLPAGPVLLIQSGPPIEFDGMAGFFAASELPALGAWLEANRETLRGRVDPLWIDGTTAGPS